MIHFTKVSEYNIRMHVKRSCLENYLLFAGCLGTVEIRAIRAYAFFHDFQPIMTVQRALESFFQTI